MSPAVIITGSSGYLGSALCVELARDHRIIGIDRRPASPAQRRAAREAQWELADISDSGAVRQCFRKAAADNGGIDTVIHFAVYYHYGKDWRREYEAVNIEGTRNIIEAACRLGVKRVVFAASIAALIPPPPGQVLNERATDTTGFPYGRSKAAGELLFAERAAELPAVVLRLGGVFSDWCELPPLASLMRLWCRRGPVGRCMPGSGQAGFPYIHRDELVRVVRRVLERNDTLDRHEVLFVSEDGCTCHRDLFQPIRRGCGHDSDAAPIHVPPVLVALFLYLKLTANTLRRRNTYEQPWMLAYADRPLRVDTAYSRSRLDWTPRPEYGIMARLPILMTNFTRHRRQWAVRNTRRNEGRYEYES
jgi:nucleoside-diphosphate-sugar epimerase